MEQLGTLKTELIIVNVFTGKNIQFRNEIIIPGTCVKVERNQVNIRNLHVRQILNCFSNHKRVTYSIVIRLMCTVRTHKLV